MKLLFVDLSQDVSLLNGCNLASVLCILSQSVFASLIVQPIHYNSSY